MAPGETGERQPAQPRLGLYLHVPFCHKRCTYCAFVTRGVSDARVERYLAALHREIALRASDAAGRRIHTVFLGGGTPTVLTPSQLLALGAALRESFDLDAVVEYTSEANPEGVTPERVAALRAIGVTRVSVGAQSAVTSELRAVARTHDRAGVESAVAAARAGGLDDVNLDLMMGLPGQTLASWGETLDAYRALEPTHLSFYGLTLEPATLLEREVKRGARLPSDDSQAAMYDVACEALAAGGWDHYETSNAARPGHRSRHNLGYWRRDDYIGLGPGAHGLLGPERTANTGDLETYAARLEAGEVPVVTRETLTLGDAVAETMFLGLRLADGVDLAHASQRVGVPLAQVYAEVLDRHTRSGALLREGERVAIAPAYRFVSHEVLADFLAPSLDYPAAPVAPSTAS